MNFIKSLVLAGALLGLSSTLNASYSEHPEAQKLIAELVVNDGFEQAKLEHLFTEAERKQSIIDAISRPAEKTLTWKDYRKIFLGSKRQQQGVEFWREHAKTLARAEQEFGVPAEIIVAIIGVETRYGRHAGSYRVLDALSTLAFDYPKRAKFFRKELREFLLLAREQQQDPLSLIGSYAGAMGYGQFIPSSYRAYAVDYDQDGFVDIWANPVDAIGSVANYFKRHHWRKGEPVTLRSHIGQNYDAEVLNQSLKPKYSVAELNTKGFKAVAAVNSEQPATIMRLQGSQGAEFWLGLHNFYVITRYNHSRLYAMAVYQLAQEIRQLY